MSVVTPIRAVSVVAFIASLLTTFACVSAAEKSNAEHAFSVLESHCVKCHGGEKVLSAFSLTTREGLLAGGASGVSVIGVG